MRLFRDTVLEINNKFWLISGNNDWTEITKRQFDSFIDKLKNGTLPKTGWIATHKLGEETESKQWQVDSSSGKDFYTVKLHANGTWSCNCVGFTFRRKCRHIEELKNKIK